MRTLAIFAIDFSRAKTVGLREKAIGLIRAARAEGLDIDLVAINGNKLFFFKANEFELRLPSLSSRPMIISALRSYDSFWRQLGKKVKLSKYDAIWWRAHPPSGQQYSFLRMAKTARKLMIFDIPTYPFCTEAKGLRGVFYKLNYSRTLKIFKLADYILTSSPHTTIEGRPTLYVSNGFDPKKIKPARPRKSGIIRLVGVGQWAYWHGLDRLFLGIAEAGLSDKFIIDLAGVGPELYGLKKMASQLKLNVNWYPAIWGDDRSALLSDADVAIGTLAIHRKSVLRDRSLKHRFYASAGLPVILTSADSEISLAPLVIIVEQNDDAINAKDLMQSLLSFREKTLDDRIAQQLFAKKFNWRETYANLWGLLRVD